VHLPVGTDLSAVAAGHTIRLAGRSDGIAGSDIFRITSVDDGNDVVEVTPMPGAASGQDWVIGGAWRTFQRAMDVVQAGDHVWVKADGAYEEKGDLTSEAGAVIRRAGMMDAPIVFEGYVGEPGDSTTYRASHPELRPNAAELDARRAVIDGAANGLSIGLGVDSALPFGSALHYVFRNVRVAHCGGGLVMDVGFRSGVGLENCRVTACSGGDGAALVPLAHVDSCVFDHNGGHGLKTGAQCHVCHSMMHDNDGAGLWSTGGSVFGNLMYANALGGIAATAAYERCAMINNTLVGTGLKSGDVAVALSGSQADTLINNIVSGFDVGVAAMAVTRAGVVRSNVYHDNDADTSQFPAGVGDQSVADIGFVDADTGDYRLRGDSPAVGAGAPAYMDAGAWQRRARGGQGSPTNVGMQM
jgi:hypothetical protein